MVRLLFSSVNDTKIIIISEKYIKFAKKMRYNTISFGNKNFGRKFEIWFSVGCLQTPYTGGKPGSKFKKIVFF